MTHSLPSSRATSAFALCRIPIPHALRRCLPKAEHAEAALDQVLRGGPLPAIHVERISDALAKTSGHAVLSAPPSWTDAQLRWAYVVVLRHLGQLNDRYGLLFDVVDRGLDHTKSNAPVSKTRAATGMHTDSSDATYNPDVVALLCLQPGSVGGQSLLADAEGLLARMRESSPALESVARKAWPRDVVTPGLAHQQASIEANSIPVIAEDDHGLVFRYMRFWTERAMVKLGREVPKELTSLLDFIDADMAKNAVRFDLKRGQMLLANNRKMVHGREAFEDVTGSARRCLVRAWVDGFIDSRRLPLSLRA